MHKRVMVKQSNVHFLGLNICGDWKTLSIPGGKCNMICGWNKILKTVFEAFGSIHF